MPAFSAAFGSFHAKSSSTSLVKLLVTVTVLPFLLTVTFLRSCTLMVSSLGVRWYSAQRYRSTQMSTTRHSSRISMELAASLTSFGAGSGVLAVATCTGGDSGGGICDEFGNAASTIDSGSSEAGVMSVAVPVTDSAAVATSALATSALAPVALSIAVAFGEAASSASAVRDGARRSSIGTAPEFSILAVAKPGSRSTTQPARTTVPHNAAATFADRRGLIIWSPPKAPPEPCCTAKHATGLIFRINMDAQWRKLQVINFLTECCPNATRRRRASASSTRSEPFYWNVVAAVGAGDCSLKAATSFPGLPWPQATIDRRRHHSRQDIEARYS